MEDLAKARYVAGECSREEAAAAGQAAGSDAMLANELDDQLRIDRALEVILADDTSDERVIGVVMRRVAAESDDRRDSREPVGENPLSLETGERTLVNPAFRNVPWKLVATLAACLGAGLLIGTQWPAAAPDGPATAVWKSLLNPRAKGSAKVSGRLEREAEILRLLGEATANSIAGLYVQVESREHGFAKTAAKELVLYRWAELDPHGAIDFLAALEDGAPELRTLFAAWARIDPNGAWSAIPSLESPSLRDAAAREILSWLSHSDPDKFIDLARNEATSDRRSWRRAFEAITATGRDVNDFMEGLSESQRGFAIGGIADSLVARDAPSALRWARQFEDESDRRFALSAVIESMAKVDPDAAGEALRDSSDRFPRLERRIVRSLASQNAGRAFEWIRAFGGEEPRGDLYRELGTTLSKSGDDQLFAVFDAIIEIEGPDAFRGDDWFQRTLWGSAGLDYRQGFDWVLQLPKDVYANRAASMRGMIFSWAKHDMAGARDYVMGIENDHVRNDLHSAIVHHMLSMNHPIERAWEYSKDLPVESPHRGRSMVDVIVYLARSKPADAAALIDQLPADANAPMAIERIAGEWGALAPQDATEWALELDQPEWQSLAISRIAAAWSQNDSYRASQWIGSLQRGALRDLAVEQLVKAVAPFEADSALSWAAAIDDAEIRRRVSAEAVSLWSVRDSLEGQSVIESSGLPLAEREQLIDLLEKESK